MFCLAAMLGTSCDSRKKDASVDQLENSGEALTEAVQEGDLARVVTLLEKGVSPSARIETGGSLVAHALRQKKQAAAKLLLDAGADPNSKGASGELLARIAVEEKQLVILRELVERGVDLKAISENGGSFLHVALENGDGKMFRFLLENEVSPNEKNSAGETSVHVAIKKSNFDLLPILEKHAASFDTLDPQGLSPLHHAIHAENDGLFKMLLDFGVDVEAVSNQGERSVVPLSLAIEKNHFAMAEQLLRCGAKPRDEMYRAVERGGDDGLQLVELLLANGATPSPVRSFSLDSPIALGVRTGQFDIAKALFEAGVTHNLFDPCGQKLLHVAVARSHSEMVDLILDQGADPNEPFHFSLSRSFLEMVKSKGVARWALKNSRNLYPIMLASDSGNVAIAQSLIARGASTSRTARIKGVSWWPLTFASRRSDLDMMQVMLGREPGKSELWIKVDLSEQRAYVYRDEKQIYKTRISSGKKGHRTPEGKFVITNKYRDWESTIYESEMPYFQRLSASDFGFHVGHVPGYAASHGCIRMPTSAARKLFGMTKVGDYVEIVK